ncbi:MAG: nucleotidyltransferase domain-containing protein [Nanoarchaeota archaeon]|nr:nucleotidyltransferase domain-containing protein [Nanoarchaeota archaeon]
MDYYSLLNKNVINILEVINQKKLYFNQISELTGIKSRNNLLKNLNKLVDLKILKKEKNKSNTFYSINYDNQFSLVLLQLININKFQNLPFERRKALTELISATKPLIAVLFGSTAKNNFKRASDIDILIVYSSRIMDIQKEIRDISSRYSIKIASVVLKYSEINTKDETTRHIFRTGYPIVGHTYFYEMLKNV